jgi:hypothetical protein
VLVQGEEAYIFYFTHPHRRGKVEADVRDRYTSVQVARLTSDGETLFCDRNEEFDFALRPPEDGE